MTQHAAATLERKSEAERLDKEISERFKKLSAGTASSDEISEGTSLLRQRANGMMPGIFAIQSKKFSTR